MTITNAPPQDALSVMSQPPTAYQTTFDPTSHSNVYVKNLPEEVDEATMAAIFQPFGCIECCRVQRNPRNTTGLTFGFVKYGAVEQAQAAIAGMNGAMVGTSVLEVKLADADPTEKALNGKTPSDNLYVRNLPNTLDDRQLRDLFTPYGGVLDCRILHNGEGQRGAGALVRMASVEEATLAINALNGQRPPGGSDILLVRYADTEEEKAKRKDRKKPGPVAGGTARFSPYTIAPKPGIAPMAGMIQPAPGPAYSIPGYSAWPAGVADPMAAVGAYQSNGAYAMHGMPGYEMYTAPIPQQPQEQCSSIYIKNLPSDCGKLFLYEKFAPFGPIQSVKTLEDETGACRGVGFVNFGDGGAASRAVQALNGAKVGERNLHVSLQAHRPPRQGV